ncbi:MAG TPA: radical SAM protein [Candidatus Methylomirabilis sp.]|nr:radical SAM protein [Candidatus Methylomirabilis sp.]
MRVKIENLHKGCENNALFLTRAWRYFRLNGHVVSDVTEEADLVFVGGCIVSDQMRSRCEGTIRELMQQLPRARFVVFGCLAAFPEGLRAAVGRDDRRLHVIDYRASHELDELIRARIPFNTVNATHLREHIPYQPRMGQNDCFVMIAQGCVNDCSYCNIKKAKGHVVSRPEEAIEAEARDLYARGLRTLTLLADDCGSYGLDRGSNLPDLLARLGRIATDLRFKLYTVFPALFQQYARRMEPLFAEGRVPYVCLPAQSAAPRILDLMNRRYDPGRLAESIARLRALDPEVFVYSHFIFSFPTETWEEFEQSVAFAQHFDHCLFIAYSENSGTRAAALLPKNRDEEREVKARRLQELVGRGELAAFVLPSV